MAFVSDGRAYVSLLGSNDLLEVDPTASFGNEITDRIDLGVFGDAADTDGKVEAGSMEMVGKYLFVALQRLDNFSVVAEGVVAVVDTETNQLVDVDPSTPGVVDPIVLSGRNPVYMRYNAGLGKLVVSEVGSFFDQTDGGIEVVDPLSFEAGGFIIDEAGLGGDVGDVVIVDNVVGFAVVGGFSSNRVVAFDVDVDTGTGVITGSNGRDLVSGLSFIPSLALDGAKRLLVPDRTLSAPGLRIIDTLTEKEITSSPIDVGLPPKVVVLFQ
jgi:hypothetical protein